MVFPAQAGMILDFSSGIEKPLGIPRTSGDDPKNYLDKMWGSLVFPAQAGMIPGESYGNRLFASIPRAGGDDPRSCRSNSACIVYSPRRRG